MSENVLRIVKGREERTKEMRERLDSWLESLFEDDPDYPAEIQGVVMLGFYADGRNFTASKVVNIPGVWGEARIILEAQEQVRLALSHQSD